jgi:arabinofuranosyltransferase
VTPPDGISDPRHDQVAPDLGSGVRATGTAGRLPVTRVVERYGIVATGALCALLGWQYRWTADDAFINYRAIRNLLAGNGMVFNAGQRIEVTTSPLWGYVLALLDVVVPGTGMEWISVWGGIALSVTGVVLGCLGCLRLQDRLQQPGLMIPFGAVVFLALPPVWDFITSGLETGLAFAWLGASWWGLTGLALADRDKRRPVWLLVTIGLGPLIRPDLAVVTVALALYVVLTADRSWLRRGLDLAMAAALPVAYEVYRMGYYGLLVPNTAVAKESTRSLWARGLTYLSDFTGPYLLAIPAVVVAGALGLSLWDMRDRRRVVGLVATFLAAGSVHVLLVVRVGGDFMHGRLLLPGVMMALLPVFLIRLTRRRVAITGALVAVVAVWAAACLSSLRVDYPASIGPNGFADERGWYSAAAGLPNPVTLADHTRAALAPYGDNVQELQENGRDVVVAQAGPPYLSPPDFPVLELGPSTGGVVFLVGNAGFYGYDAGLDVVVTDFYGLADPIGAHMEAPAPRRPGHEKRIPLEYLIAMYGEGDFAGAPVVDVLIDPGYAAVDAADVAAARAVLRCGEVAELLAATSDELTPGRFWDNLTGSVARTDMRLLADPQAERRRVCD